MTTQNPLPLCPKNTSQHDARRAQWWQNLQWAQGDYIGCNGKKLKKRQDYFWQLWEDTSKLAANAKGSGKNNKPFQMQVE